jgi:hypothetical protein
VGQADDKGKSAATTLNQYYPASQALHPYSPDDKGKSATAVDQIVVRKRAGKGVAEANREVTAFLRERHKTARGQADDFDIRDFSEFEKLLEKAKP